MRIFRFLVILQYLLLPVFLYLYSRGLIYPSLSTLLILYILEYLAHQRTVKNPLVRLSAQKIRPVFNRILHLVLYLYFFDKFLIPFWLFLAVFVRYLAELISIPFLLWRKRVYLIPSKTPWDNPALVLSLANIPLIFLAFHNEFWVFYKIVQNVSMPMSFFLEIFLFFKFLSRIFEMFYKKKH